MLSSLSVRHRSSQQPVPLLFIRDRKEGYEQTSAERD